MQEAADADAYERVNEAAVQQAWKRLQDVAVELNMCPHALLEQVGYRVTDPHPVAMVKVCKRDDGRVWMDAGRTLRTMTMTSDQAHEIGKALCAAAEQPAPRRH